MSREITELAYCDFCGEEAVLSYTLSNGEMTVITDVCEEHATPFVHALEVGTAEGRARKARPGDGRTVPKTHRVVPVD